jgi:hypothetical protein
MSQKVKKLVHDLFDLDLEIAIAEKRLNAMKARRHLIATVDLPEAMTEASMSYTELDDGSGLSCAVDFKVYGSLPSRDNEDARQAAIDYLKEHDAAELITADVRVSYGRGDISAANRLKRMLLQKTNQPVFVDANVHHSTLAAWARNRIKENQPVDLTLLGLRGMTMAAVKKVKS